MNARAQAQAEARFLKGETGVDGASGKVEVDPEVAEQAKAKEALYRGRAWLGREALCWILMKSESAEPLCKVDGQPLRVVFTGKILLRAGSGEVTEVAAKGVSAPYASIVRFALARNLLVHGARLQLTHGEQSFEVTLDAERFDLRAGKLPALLNEGDEGEELVERLELVSRLGRLIDALLAQFIKVRVGPQWEKSVVPELKAWFAQAD
ncbi:MAG: hypothetical protein H6Q89_4470 [Myxococcaceae bacterium]|nr:hypothetical protein [Myxococcaceae bacterium]